MNKTIASVMRRTGAQIPEIAAVLGGLALLVALALLPGPFSGAHAFAVLGVALSFVALVAFLPARQGQRSDAEAGQLVRLDAIADQLELRAESLQDLQWRASEQESRFRQLLDAQSDLILRVDQKRRLTFANKAFCDMFEVLQDDVLGQPFSPEVLNEGDGKPATSPWFFADHGQSEPVVQLIATPKGERWVSWQVNELGADQSGLFEFELVGRDVTLERQHQQEIDEARQLAESANVAKSRFLAAMSHEIRTPMNGIMGMAALLRDTSLSDEQSTYVNAINQSANTLLSLIDEILDFSKIEAGRLSLSAEPFAIADSVRDAVELLAPRAHSKGLELAWIIAPDVPERVIGDSVRVRQVLLNLLSNAIKFTDAGGVVVSVELGCTFDQDGETQHQVLFHVKDTGVGLSAEAQEKLFKEFERSVADGNMQPEGTGLGLAISRRLARAMAGDISIVSEPGEGSTFTAELVLEGDASDEHGQSPAQATANDNVVHQSRVLLAIDHPIERDIQAQILTSHGHIAVQVGFHDAAEAIRAASRNGETFDAVVVDCGVPPTAAGKLIADAAALGRRPNGLVIAEVSERARIDLFREVGYDAFAIRPVRPNVFLERAGIGLQAPEPKRAAPPRAEAEAECESESVSLLPEKPDKSADHSKETQPPVACDDGVRRLVLVVEDNEINTLLATKVLERAGHDVLTAATGTEAIKHMRLALQGAARMPDAILMDIFLPDIDGVETSKQIRNLFKSADRGAAADCPPIVALTAHAFAEDRRRYLEEGLDDCLTKPFVPADLVRVLMRLFCERQKPANPAA